jgi:hypothetical protein
MSRSFRRLIQAVIQAVSWVGFAFGLCLIAAGFVWAPEPHDISPESEPRRLEATRLERTGGGVAIGATILAYFVQGRRHHKPRVKAPQGPSSFFLRDQGT